MQQPPPKLALAQKGIWEISFIRVFLAGYFLCVVLGWLLLQFPLFQRFSISGIDLLFAAASAVSTTGLATVDIGQIFTLPGQVLFLLLIQLGGIGYMFFSSFIVLHRSSPPWGKLFKSVLLYTAICEMGGVVVLYILFEKEGVERSFWSAVFHSVSAFCTAGFSLFSTNIESFKNRWGINLVLSFLSILGAFGFFFWIDLLKERSTKIITRMARSSIFAIILLGTLLFVLTAVFRAEGGRLLLFSFFQTVSAVTTAGFNTIDMRVISPIATISLLILMLVGVSFTCQNRDVKSTTLPHILKLLLRIHRRRGAKVLLHRMRLVTVTFTHFLFVLFLACIVLVAIEKGPVLPLLFEAASALCTVGLSSGITANLSFLGKSFIILLMLIGRMSIFVFGFMASRQFRFSFSIIDDKRRSG